MLVGRSVEDHLRAEGPEGIIEARDHPHVTDHGNKIQFRIALLQLQTDVVHRRLGVVEQDQLLHSESHQLAAQFRTDRAGSSRHHDRLAAEIRDDLVHRDLDLLTAKQVLDLDLADRLLHQLAGDHLVDGRGDQHLETVLRAMADQPLLLVLRLIVRREEHGVDVVAILKVFDVVVRLEIVDRIVGENMILEPLAIGQEAHDPVVGRVLEPSDQRHRLVSRAVDQHPFAVLAPDRLVLDQIIEHDHHQPHRQQQEEREQDVDHESQRRGRKPGLRIVRQHPEHIDEQQRILQRHGGDQFPHLAQRRGG